MKPTHDAKAAGIKKMQDYEMPEMKVVDQPMKDGHTKLSGSLMDELRGGAMMPDGAEEEENSAADVPNVFGAKSPETKTSQDYTRLAAGKKQGPNKMRKMSPKAKF